MSVEKPSVWSLISLNIIKFTQGWNHMNVISVANPSLWIWLSLSIKELIPGRDPMGAVNVRTPTKSQTSQTSENTREKPHKYNECGKAFCMKSTLIIYQWTHSVDKSFKCSECEKSFYVKLLLNSHQRYHTGKKSHVCKVCGKAFSMKSSLTGLSEDTLRREILRM